MAMSDQVSRDRAVDAVDAAYTEGATEGAKQEREKFKAWIESERARYPSVDGWSERGLCDRLLARLEEK